MPSKSSVQEHLSRHDREIAAIRKLVLQGMKLMIELQKGQKELQAAQKKTEQTLERFMRSLERGGVPNGHDKKTRIN